MSRTKIIILLILAIFTIVNAEKINPKNNADPKSHQCQKAPGNWIGNGQSIILGYMTCDLSNIIWDVLKDGNDTYVFIR